jgi:type I restriction enzyme S subunit
MNLDKSRWPRVRFGDVVTLNTDRCADPVAAGIERYVGLEHIEPEDLRIRRWGLVEEGTTFTNRFRPGQVLFGKRRAYQRKVAVANFEGVCSSDIYVFEPKDDHLLPALLPFLCQTEAFYEHAVGTSAGSLSPRTNWTQLAGYEFALPPMEEQRRIAELLHYLGNAISRHQDLLYELNRMRSAITTKIAFLATGSFRFVREAEMSVGWKLCPLADICSDIVDCLHRTPNYTTKGFPAIRTTDVNDGELDLEGARCVALDEYALQTSRLEPLPGDILFSREAPMGHAALVPDGVRLCISQRMMHMRCEATVDARYLMEMLNSQFVRDQVDAFSIGSTVQHINVADVKRLLVPVPSLEIQKNYALRIKACRDAKVSSQERLYSMNRAKAMLLANTLN